MIKKQKTFTTLLWDSEGEQKANEHILAMLDEKVDDFMKDKSTAKVGFKINSSDRRTRIVKVVTWTE